MLLEPPVQEMPSSGSLVSSRGLYATRSDGFRRLGRSEFCIRGDEILRASFVLAGSHYCNSYIYGTTRTGCTVELLVKFDQRWFHPIITLVREL